MDEFGGINVSTVEEVIHGSVRIFYKQGAGFAIQKESQAEANIIKVKDFICISLDELDIDAEEFKDVPLNKFGLKEVAQFKDYKLVLTACNLFVVYHKLLPSIVGLPTEVQTVSGLWIDSDGHLCVPQYTIFDEDRFRNSAVISKLSSFRTIPLEKSIQDTPIQRCSIIEYSDETFPCDCFSNQSGVESIYINRFPTFSVAQYYEYKEMLKEQGESFVYLPELSPQVINTL